MSNNLKTQIAISLLLWEFLDEEAIDKGRGSTIQRVIPASSAIIRAANSCLHQNPSSKRGGILNFLHLLS